MLLTLNLYHISAIALIILLIIFIIYVRFSSPIIRISSQKIWFIDLLLPNKILADSIISIKLLDRMPAIKYDHFGHINRYDPKPLKAGKMIPSKGYCEVVTDDGIKQALSYSMDYKKCCIEIATTSGMVYINYKNEERTKHLYEKFLVTFFLIKK